MGRVAAPFGVKGWIKVQTFTEEIDGLLAYATWWVGKDGSWQEFKVEEGAPHGQVVLAKLTGTEDREAVAKLKGMDIAVPREVLPEVKDGYYWSDLVGLQVVNREGIEFGRVESLLRQRRAERAGGTGRTRKADSVRAGLCGPGGSGSRANPGGLAARLLE